MEPSDEQQTQQQEGSRSREQVLFEALSLPERYREDPNALFARSKSLKTPARGANRAEVRTSVLRAVQLASLSYRGKTLGELHQTFLNSLRGQSTSVLDLLHELEEAGEVRNLILANGESIYFDDLLAKELTEAVFFNDESPYQDVTDMIYVQREHDRKTKKRLDELRARTEGGSGE